MKEYKYLYQKMLDPKIVRLAYNKLRKGKTKRPEIQYIDIHYEEESNKIIEMIFNTKPDGVYVPRPDLAYRPTFIKPTIIKEYVKTRKIYKPEMIDQWIHHIIVIILEPIILSHAYCLSCGSMPKKGGLYGKKHIARWIKRGVDIKYFAKMDIRHFFASVKYDILFNWLRVRINDEWFLYFIRLCFMQFKKGLILGFYISQWLSNYLLESLDRYIIEWLGHKKYIRYVDDIVIFANSKKILHRSIESIKQFLKKRLHLKLKKNYKVCKFDYHGKGTFLDFMGFKFYRYKITLRKRILKASVKLARKLYRDRFYGKRFYLKHIRAILSYMGWFKHTNSYKVYMRKIKHFVDLGHLKAIISHIDTKNNS